MYARNLKAHKGTDNRILIEFVNQDQKPTPLNGIDFMFRIISMTGEKLLLEKKLEIVNKGRGQARVILTEQELDIIQTGTHYYSVERHYFPYASLPIEPPIDPETGLPITPVDPIYPPECLINGPTGPQDPVNPEDFEQVDYEPTYVDDNAGGRGNIEILDSIMPSFVRSNILTIPDPGGLPDEFNSSIIQTEEQLIHTFQIELNSFTGTITFQGGNDTDNQWYDIISESYTGSNEVLGANIEGYHPYMRINVTNNTIGSIDNIIYR